VADAEPEPTSPDDETAGPRREDLEKLRRDLAEFVRLEVQIAAAAREPQLRRAGVDALGGLAAAVALVAAFVLVNVAALLAIATVLPGWAAALILAAGWIIVALVAGTLVASHARPLLARLRGDGPRSPEELQAARDRAWQDVQADIAVVAPPLTERAIAIAAPIAARVAMSMATDLAVDVAEDMAGEVEDVGRELVEESEEIVEDLAEEIPGGTTASTVWDLALLPGRTGIRMVTTVLKRPPSES
jgi:hypothetical protein